MSRCDAKIVGNMFIYTGEIIPFNTQQVLVKATPVIFIGGRDDDHPGGSMRTVPVSGSRNLIQRYYVHNAENTESRVIVTMTENILNL